MLYHILIESQQKKNHQNRIRGFQGIGFWNFGQH